MSGRRFAYATATGPVILRVLVTDACVAAGALFPDDRCPDPGGEPHVVLASSQGGFVVRSGGTRLEVGELTQALVETELVLAAELVRRSGLPGLHAAGVVLRGRAVLMPGEGGRGKSSLTAALACRGHAVLGDDVVLLDAAGRAHAFRRLIKVEEPARSILGLPAPPEPLGRIWPAAFYRPADLGSRWAEPTPVGAIVVPERTDGVETSLVPLRPSELLRELLAGVVLSDRIEPGTFESLTAALADAECWTLRYGTTPEGVETLLEALG